MSNQALESKPPKVVYDLASEYALLELDSDNETQEKLWIRMGSELEVANFARHKISSTLHEIIEDKIWELKFKNEVPREKYSWHSGHFYRVMKKQHWGNPFYAHDAPSRERENSSLNNKMPEVIKQLARAYNGIADEIDQFVTKLNTEFYVFGISETDDQELKFIQFQNLITSGPATTKQIQEFGKIFAANYEKKQDLENCIHSLNSFCDILKGIRDEKMKIPLNTIHVLLYCLATEASVSYGAEKFFEKRIELIHKTRKQLLTAKQATKFQKGDTDLELPIFNPKNRDMAIFQRYYGLQCPKCKSFRVKEKGDDISEQNLICRDCKHVFAGKTSAKCRYCQMPLFKEELKHIVDTWKVADEEEDVGDQMSGGHCPNCNSINHLPEELILYAKS